MARNLLLVILAGGIVLPVSLASPAAGQSILRRLEQEIRQRVAEDQAAAEATPQPRPTQTPGYLGAVVDDRQDRGRGVRVLDVRPAGPADQAGLREGDLITGVAGVRVRQTEDLADVMAVFPAGSRVAFDVLRDGQAAKIDIVLGQRDTPADVPLPLPETVPLPLPEPMADPGDAPGAALEAPLPPDSDLSEPETTPSEAAPAARPEDLERLLARIAELERRVEQLEQALAEALERP